DELELGKTNFGFFGLRVAASLSALYGGGKLTSSEGGSGEPAIFQERAKWVDYSGPIAEGADEGVTWFDHPSNSRHPTRWHRRHRGPAAGPPPGHLVLLLGRVRRAQLVLRDACDPLPVHDAGAAHGRHEGRPRVLGLQDGVLLPAAAGRHHRRPLARPLLDHR